MNITGNKRNSKRKLSAYHSVFQALHLRILGTHILPTSVLNCNILIIYLNQIAKIWVLH
uniref:Uncharacterized protein n=1 Tax=Rhizophora mucronata TaxID=61149 RepID=A0A2P2N8N5_RHIMU